MAFNVSEMLSTINANGGISKASKFLVRISPPGALRTNIDADFMFFCDSASLPGISFQSEDIRMAGYGNTEKRPYATIFQDVNVTFFNDSDSKVLRFLHLWMQSVYNFNDKTNPNATARGLVNNTFAYPQGDNAGDGYYGVVEIIHFDETEREIITYELNECYPISIGEVLLDWNQNDTLVKIPVTFTYTYWVADTLDPGVIDERSSARANALTSYQTRIGEDFNNITELLNVTSPARIQRIANRLTRFF